MSPTLLITFLATLVAGLPLLASRRASLLNPALYVFMIVASSLFLKAVYISLVHPSPTTGHDRIYIGATSPDVFVAGALLGLTAVVAYTGGFLAIRRWTPTLRLPERRSEGVGAWNAGAIIALAAFSLACFVIYLKTSDTQLFELPFSAKRFLPKRIGVPTRFQYPPYYFFKLSSLSGPAAFAAALLLFHTRPGRYERVFRWAAGFLFFLALLLAHFASLRLSILIVLGEIVLLALYTRQRRHVAIVSTFVLSTAVSFAVITFVHRIPEPQSVVAVSEETPGDLARRPVASPEGEATELPQDSVEAAPGIAEEEAPPTKASRADRPPVSAKVRIRTLGEAAFGGRYLLDLTKLAHLAHHFPRERDWLQGRSLVGGSIDANEDRVNLGRYIALAVFQEPENHIPAGYAGELYVNFGWSGVVAGFLILGLFHRLVFNYLVARPVSLLAKGFLILLIPATTLVLLNSGILPAAARCALDFGIVLIACSPRGVIPRLPLSFEHPR